jgi:predicted RNA-binding Zn-ribbon protein involved in translation (DUF1610 family)
MLNCGVMMMNLDIYWNFAPMEKTCRAGLRDDAFTFCPHCQTCVHFEVERCGHDTHRYKCHKCGVTHTKRRIKLPRELKNE